MMREQPLTCNLDIISSLVAFVDHDQFLFFALVCKAWRASWRQQQRPTVTRAVTPHSSVSQLLSSLECGLPRSFEVSRAIAQLGNLELLQSARENGCPCDCRTCGAAAQAGHLGVVQWLRYTNCPWNGRVCARAALGGHLDVLKWLRENDCPWDSLTCAGAAEGGHVKILLWARENGMSWNDWTCAGAAEGGHLHILEWLRAQGCPWSAVTCRRAAKQVRTAGSYDNAGGVWGTSGHYRKQKPIFHIYILICCSCKICHDVSGKSNFEWLHNGAHRNNLYSSSKHSESGTCWKYRMQVAVSTAAAAGAVEGGVFREDCQQNGCTIGCPNL